MTAAELQTAIERLQRAGADPGPGPSGDSAAARNERARRWAARNPDVARDLVSEHPVMRGGMVPIGPRWHVLLYLAGADLTADRDGLSVLADVHGSLVAPKAGGVVELPRFARVSPADVRMLPGFEGGGLAPVRDAVLPGFGPVASAVPSWLLAIYDQAGGVSEARGRGAPWDLRLFVGALLSLPVELRNGSTQRMRLTTGDLARWLQPGGWDRHPTSFERMRRSLRELDRLRVPVEVAGTSGGLLKVVSCRLLPREFDRGRGPIIVEASIPGGAARGARVDWDRLTRYGAKSASIYRAYLSVVAVLDHSSRAGKALTAEIPAPILDRRGQPKRRKGKIMRSSTATVPNPAARYVGWLTDEDLRAMVGLAADHRQNRKRSREAIEYPRRGWRDADRSEPAGARSAVRAG